VSVEPSAAYQPGGIAARLVRAGHQGFIRFLKNPRLHDDPLNVIHVVYSSAAVVEFSRDDLVALLEHARCSNASRDVTGMLLYVDGSFFQILEGPEEAVDALCAKIKKDPRHEKMTVIMREPIAKRLFSEWTMGFANVDAADVREIDGLNDFFSGQRSLADIDNGRAKKLLFAFSKGRWRARLGANAPRLTPPSEPERSVVPVDSPRPAFSFAYQPIVDAARRCIVGYEALVRGPNDEPSTFVTQRIALEEIGAFDADLRRMAIGMAARLGLEHELHLSMIPQGSWSEIRSHLQSTLDTALRCGIEPDRVVLELKHEATLSDPAALADCLKDVRREGMRISIDDFGSGHAGLALLDHYHPEVISLSMWLVRGIEEYGPRQAIVRGLLQTCSDLGIDIIAKGVSSTDEFAWLVDEGIELYQGELFAPAGFESLPRPMMPIG